MTTDNTWTHCANSRCKHCMFNTEYAHKTVKSKRSQTNAKFLRTQYWL